jgi:hypothetical protein
VLKAAEDVLRAAEDVVRKAEDEARYDFHAPAPAHLLHHLTMAMYSAADADLKRQQDEFKNSCDALEAKINNPATGQVAKGQAVQQVNLSFALSLFC